MSPVIGALALLFVLIASWQVRQCRRDRHARQSWQDRNRQTSQGLPQRTPGTHLQTTPDSPGAVYPAWSASEVDACIGRIRALPERPDVPIIPSPRRPEEDR